MSGIGATIEDLIQTTAETAQKLRASEQALLFTAEQKGVIPIINEVLGLGAAVTFNSMKGTALLAKVRTDSDDKLYNEIGASQQALQAHGINMSRYTLDKPQQVVQEEMKWVGGGDGNIGGQEVPTGGEKLVTVFEPLTLSIDLGQPNFLANLRNALIEKRSQGKGNAVKAEITREVNKLFAAIQPQNEII